MRLKKYLKRLGEEQKGQVVMEYFILLCVLLALTIIGSSTFFKKVSHSTDSFSQTAYQKMKQTNLGSFKDKNDNPTVFVNATN